MTIEFTVPGTPVAKARPRTARLPNGGTRHYTPAKTEQWEARAAYAAHQAIIKAGTHPYQGPVAVIITAVFPVPDSWPKWRREAAMNGEVVPTAKPDMDNVEKAVKDAMNGVVYRDDAQVVVKVTELKYGEEPGVHVAVKETGQRRHDAKRDNG